METGNEEAQHYENNRGREIGSCEVDGRGLDLGDGSSFYCLLDQTGQVLLKLGTTAAAIESGVPRKSTEPDRFGNGHASAPAQPAVGRTGTPGNDGPCAQPAHRLRQISALQGGEVQRNPI
jgi:hypothetical protein